jgi:hypothetical protein
MLLEAKLGACVQVCVTSIIGALYD